MERSRLAGCTVLAVEDEPLVGLDLVDVLRAAGAHVVSAKSAGEAISSLDRCHFTAAVLDINLGNHDCAAVCQRLQERAIPFVFHTGYTVPLAGWESVSVIRKSSVPREIVEAVERLCGLRAARLMLVEARGINQPFSRNWTKLATSTTAFVVIPSEAYGRWLPTSSPIRATGRCRIRPELMKMWPISKQAGEFVVEV